MAGSRLADQRAGVPRDPARGELGRAAPRTPPATAGSARRAASPATTVERSSRPRAARWSCTSSAVSLGRGRALERRRRDGHDHVARRRTLEHVAGGERAGHRVELVPGLDAARASRPGRRSAPSATTSTSPSSGPASVSTRRATGSIERTVVCTNRTPGGARSRVAVQDVLGARLPEHHVELGEAEDEAFGPVDQRHLDVGPECRVERAGELEAAEAGAQDQHAHRPNPSARSELDQRPVRVGRAEQLRQRVRALEDQLGVVLPGDRDAAVQLHGLGGDPGRARRSSRTSRRARAARRSGASGRRGRTTRPTTPSGTSRPAPAGRPSGA